MSLDVQSLNHFTYCTCSSCMRLWYPLKIILYSIVGRVISVRSASVLILPRGVAFPPAFLFKFRLVVVDPRNTRKAVGSAERRARRPAMNSLGPEYLNISLCFTLQQEGGSTALWDVNSLLIRTQAAITTLWFKSTLEL